MTPDPRIWVATFTFLELSTGWVDLIEPDDLEEFAELRERMQRFGEKYAPIAR